MFRYLIMIFSSMILTACQSPPAAIDYDTSTDFSRFSNYKLDYDKPNDNNLMQQRLIASVAAHIEQTGLALTSESKQADLIIKPSLHSAQRTQEPSSRGSIGFGGGGSSSIFGISLSIPLGSESIVNDVAVEVLMLNAKTESVVWHGQYSFTVAADDPTKASEGVDRAVKAIFAQYPPAFTN